MVGTVLDSSVCSKTLHRTADGMTKKRAYMYACHRYCSMNPDPYRNSCDIPEEVGTSAAAVLDCTAHGTRCTALHTAMGCPINQLLGYTSS